MLHFRPPLLNALLEVLHAFTFVDCPVQEKVRINLDAFLKTFDLFTGVDQAVRVVLPIVRSLNLQLHAIEVKVAHDSIINLILILLPDLFLDHSVAELFVGILGVAGDRGSSLKCRMGTNVQAYLTSVAFIGALRLEHLSESRCIALTVL